MKEAIGKVGVVTVATMGLHVLLGWPMTVVGGALAGSWVEKGGVWAGLASGCLSWGMLIVVSGLRAPEETRRMLEAMAAMMGNLPWGTGVGMGLLLGSLLGGLGGAVGQQGRRWRRARASARPL